MTNYLSSATYYVTLLTDYKFFSYSKLIKQLFSISQSGGSIPHFQPFNTKEDRLRNKEILRALENESGIFPDNGKFTKE